MDCFSSVAVDVKCSRKYECGSNMKNDMADVLCCVLAYLCICLICWQASENVYPDIE